MQSQQAAYFFAQPCYNIICSVTVFLNVWLLMVYGGGSELIMLTTKVDLPIARVIALAATLLATATYSALFYRARLTKIEKK